MKFSTKLTRLGRETANAIHSVNPPLVRTTTAPYKDIESFKQAYEDAAFKTKRYGRNGTQTNHDLQTAMVELTDAEECIATSSGLSAITSLLSSYASANSHFLVSNGIYSPAESFCKNELVERGVDVEFFSADSNIEELIKPNTRLIYIETPSSLTLEIFDIKTICQIAKARNIIVVCDASWGTPVFFSPHELGVDIAIHSASKYINGHSDVVFGLVTGSFNALKPIGSYIEQYGHHASAESCWMTLRGLRTLDVRMQRHQASAEVVANYLNSLAHVSSVNYPAFFKGEQLALWQAQFSGGAGPFTIQFCSLNEAQIIAFIEKLTLFDLGTGWGGYNSVVTPIIEGDNLFIRFHIGLEDPQDLINDIEQAINYAAS